MLLLRQIECSNTQAQMSSVSLLTIGQQAIIDAYLCLLHLTTGQQVTAKQTQYICLGMYLTAFYLLLPPAAMDSVF